MRAIAAAAVLALGACATGASDPEASNRIKQGITRLGGAEARGECLARGVTRRLNSHDEREAARIVERSLSKDDMRDGVLGANEDIRRAFIGANMSCSLFG